MQEKTALNRTRDTSFVWQETGQARTTSVDSRNKRQPHPLPVMTALRKNLRAAPNIAIQDDGTYGEKPGHVDKGDGGRC